MFCNNPKLTLFLAEFIYLYHIGIIINLHILFFIIILNPFPILTYSKHIISQKYYHIIIKLIIKLSISYRNPIFQSHPITFILLNLHKNSLILYHLFEALASTSH